MAVIDASVAVRWFIYGVGNDRAAPWLNRADLTAPDFILAEVGNAFWRYIQRGHLDLQEARAILNRLPAAFVRLVPIYELVSEALGLAKEHNHPIYDCCYLALAQREGQSLVTLDRDLAKIAEKSGVRAELLL
jgi:predicted nucleic acid-binding protein